MKRAVCIRCGGQRTGYDQVCPACGFRPYGDGLLVAWLLSEHHLGSLELDAVAARITKGEKIHPSEQQLGRARRALKRTLTDDPGLSMRDCALLFGAGLLVTPLLGWVLAFWWREERPRAAIQSLALTAPLTLLFTGGMLFVWLG